MKITGANKLQKFIRNADNLLDSSEFYAKASMVMLQSVKKNFLEKKNSDGTSWPSLKYRKGQPLRLSGRLINSISNAYDNKQAVVGTNVEYAGVHNYGYELGIFKIPQREYMFLSTKGGESIEKVTTDMLDKIAGNALI